MNIPSPIHLHVHVHLAAPAREQGDRFPDPDKDPAYWRVTDEVREARTANKVGGARKTGRRR